MGIVCVRRDRFPNSQVTSDGVSSNFYAGVGSRHPNVQAAVVELRLLLEKLELAVLAALGRTRERETRPEHVRRLVAFGWAAAATRRGHLQASVQERVVSAREA